MRNRASYGRFSLPPLTRRSFLAASLACCTPSGLIAQSSTEAVGHRAGLLVQPAGLRQLSTRSKIVLELDGQLHLRKNDPKQPEQTVDAEVKGKSTLEYFEKIAYADSATPVAAARRYLEAGVENWIAGSASSQKLRQECAETRMLVHAGQWQQYCDNETLDMREVELLHSPVNSAALELLLPREAAKPDMQWTVRAEDAKHIFNLEAVHKCTLQGKVASVEKGIATLEFEGDLDATANSVPTKLKIKGNARVTMASQSAMLTWLGVVIQEDREISEAEPGFRITARVRLIRAEEAQDRFSISDEQLRKLAAEENPGRWLVRLRSDVGRFSMLADRRWRFYLDTGEESVLRMIENNTVIAQCDISRLTQLGEGQQLTLEGLQADIRTSLGEGFGEFLESSEKLTSTKLRLLRSVVAGELEEVPIQWIYDHLSDDSGRRVALIYTMGGNVTDRFAAADEQMTASFQLLPGADPQQTDASEKSHDAKPTAAPKLSAAASSAKTVN